MRYDKLAGILKTFGKEKLEETIQHRSSSQSQSMVRRYARRKNELRMAQEELYSGKTDTGQKIEIDTSPVITGSINQTR